MNADRFQPDDLSSLALLSRADVRVLSPERERELLVELDECRKLLLTEYARRRKIQGDAATEDLDIQDVVRAMLAEAGDHDASRSVVRRYTECRAQLAMANLRLVAHVARRYRDRGLSTGDLLQEGFCGLLTAIDRYDVANTTRLASYAVWWIRQALQRAVAAGVYPVRLNPRHLQKLAASSLDAEDGHSQSKPGKSKAAAATLKRIHAATRPAVSLDAVFGDSNGTRSLLDSLCSPPDEDVDDLDRDQRVDALIQHLKPREQTVLRLRFGLDGRESQSLSQVSQVLDVSKERVRQIQDAALGKLRALASRRELAHHAPVQPRAELMKTWC